MGDPDTDAFDAAAAVEFGGDVSLIGDDQLAGPGGEQAGVCFQGCGQDLTRTSSNPRSVSAAASRIAFLNSGSAARSRLVQPDRWGG